MKNQIIPIYLVTGFLESGKTSFIQETLKDPKFNNGERTLVIMCEDGVESLDMSEFPKKSNVKLVTLEEKEEISLARFTKMNNEYKPQRVMIEYNGMWQLDQLYTELPETWQVAQEFMFVDSTTFEAYNSNMRTLMVDKFTSANTIIFNRMVKGADKMPYHKAVRGVSRGAAIIYEYDDEERSVEPDEIEDPLPFDFNAPIIEAADKDFAWLYRDIAEDPKKYVGKKVKFKGLCGVDARFPKGSFVVGRHIMVCCANDTTYRAFACDGLPDGIKHQSWNVITAEIKFEYHKIYKSEGPVLKLIDYSPAEKPEEIVATFN